MEPAPKCLPASWLVQASLLKGLGIEGSGLWACRCGHLYMDVLRRYHEGKVRSDVRHTSMLLDLTHTFVVTIAHGASVVLCSLQPILFAAAVLNWPLKLITYILWLLIHI